MFKITTKGLNYKIREAYIAMVLKIINIVIVIIFIYLSFQGYIGMDIIIRILVIYLFILFYRFLRQWIVYILTSTIESLDSIQQKLLFLSKLAKFYYFSSPYIYFIIRNVENFIKLRRWFYDKVTNKTISTYITDMFLFFFYYPFTRFFNFYYRFLLKILGQNDDDLLYSRIQGYLVMGFFFWPIMFDSFSFIGIKEIILIYYLILTFFFPLIEFLWHFYLKLRKFLQRPLTTNETLAIMAIETRNMMINRPNYSFIYPTVEYLMLIRHEFSCIYDVLHAYQAISVDKLTNPLYDEDEFPFYTLNISPGLTDARINVFLFLYLRSKWLSKLSFYYLENNRYISYSWYDHLYDLIKIDWELPYLWEFLYKRAIKNNVKITPELCDFFKTSIESYINIFGKILKLIWCIEKDWGFDPLTRLSLKSKEKLKVAGYNYPIKQYAKDMLTDSMQGLQCLKMPVEDYSKIISQFTVNKQFNSQLEEQIINFLAIDGLERSNLKASILSKVKYLMFDSISGIDDEVEREVLRDHKVQLYLKERKYHTFSEPFIDYFYREKPYFTDEYIWERFGEDVAKWRNEWEQENKINGNN